MISTFPAAARRGIRGRGRALVTGEARPLLLWLRGSADLRLTCVHSVSIVGSRTATGYGQHVAIEMAATMAEHGTATVSGGP